MSRAVERVKEIIEAALRAAEERGDLTEVSRADYDKSDCSVFVVRASGQDRWGVTVEVDYV